jgi:hypothetical protein
MKTLQGRRKAFALALVAATLTVPALEAQEDLFAFMPPGGRTLLGELIASGKSKYDDVTTERRSIAEWRAYVDGLGNAEFDGTTRETLADYLEKSMPAAEKGGKTVDTGGHLLPRDGRDLTLEYCQSCHIITVVVTQDRSREAWLGTMNKPSHVEIDTTTAEREAIADYLVLNGGISIEDIPEELRAGGATY